MNEKNIKKHLYMNDLDSCNRHLEDMIMKNWAEKNIEKVNTHHPNEENKIQNKVVKEMLRREN